MRMSDWSSDVCSSDLGQRAMGAIAASGAKPVVPRRRTTAQWRSFDSHLYKERNLIERFFNKIKHFRRIATRYDKLARNYAGFLNLVAAIKCADRKSTRLNSSH